MSHDGLFGPFKDSDDIDRYWYQVTVKELEGYIEQTNKDLKEAILLGEDTENYKRDIEMWSNELRNLRNFVDDYTRSLERYKFNDSVLLQIQDDWKDYNLSLYADYCRVQSIMLDPSRILGEGRKAVSSEAKSEKIKREEIEKRIRDLLSK
ncbi:hypothetical protein A2982_00500 [candidate division WWE3 bacterium RIFCSPLOWO2_01_FULL_39_13]|uniref:Uncharacterized protein n=1 Tax=candidate division WWE3 bacterium RIFCSPLOWO2_01_FULL_39_13 TaxID=1802624 RepID=A0A1F4V3M4_UNCKA|nr:MAG: hypothetical protein A2982_00500 [candidate division WWE3 bacterium RIFCSPLOWO2_01_FULL_39_13]